MADPDQPWSEWLHNKALELAAGRDANTLPAKVDLADLFKSAGIGLANSAVGAIGAPGDIRKQAGQAADWLGVPESAQTVVRNAVAMNPALSIFATSPGAQGVRQMAERVTGPFYQPQTFPGRVWEKATQRAGNLVMGGALVRGAQLGPRAADIVRALVK